MSSQMVIESITPMRADGLIPSEWIIHEGAAMQVVDVAPVKFQDAAPYRNMTLLTLRHWHGQDGTPTVDIQETVPNHKRFNRVHLVRFITA